MKKITITRTLSKINDTVIENFTIKPFYSILFDESRDVYYKIKYIVNRNSLQKYYNNKTKLQTNNGWINTYEYNSSVQFEEPLSKDFEFEYIPSGGSKTCDKCIFYRNYKQNDYCWLRGTQLRKKLWYKCIYWHEDSAWWKAKEMKWPITLTKKTNNEWQRLSKNTG